MMTELLSIVREAGAAALEIQQGGSLAAYSKPDEPLGSNFATAGDFAAQKIIIRRLNSAFPKIPIIAEEQDNPTELPAACWLVDPIDGTTGYFNGGEDWGVMVTRLTHGTPSHTAVFLPARNILLHAELGHGCYLNDQKQRFEYHSAKAGSPMVGIEVGPWWGESAVTNVLLPLSQKFPIVSRCSTAGGFVDLIRGQTKGWLSLKCGKPWDFAPGWLLIKEAGGVAIGADGSEPNFRHLSSMDVVYSAAKQVTDVILPLTKAWAAQK